MRKSKLYERGHSALLFSAVDAQIDNLIPGYKDRYKDPAFLDKMNAAYRAIKDEVWANAREQVDALPRREVIRMGKVVTGRLFATEGAFNSRIAQGGFSDSHDVAAEFAADAGKELTEQQAIELYERDQHHRRLLIGAAAVVGLALAGGGIARAEAVHHANMRSEHSIGNSQPAYQAPITTSTPVPAPTHVVTR